MRLSFHFINPFGPFFLHSIVFDIWKGMTAPEEPEDHELTELLNSTTANDSGATSGSSGSSSSGVRKRTHCSSANAAAEVVDMTSEVPQVIISPYLTEIFDL